MSTVVERRNLDIRFGGRDSVTGGGQRDDWRTPPTLLADIYARFGLTFDPCPYRRDPEWDGLKGEWGGGAFVNPPYGRETGAWLRKALDEIAAGRCSRAVFLIHARTDTRWWHEIVMPNASEIRFIKGRVAFVGRDGKSAPGPFPSVIVAFGTTGRMTTGPIVSTWETRDPAQRTLGGADE